MMFSGWDMLQGGRSMMRHRFDTTGYEVQVTDFQTLWKESMDKKSIIGTAGTHQCSIDPSQDDSQYDILMQKLKNGLSCPGANRLESASPEGKYGVIRLISPLPKPLPALEWNFMLRACDQSAFRSAVVMPLLSSAMSRQQQVSSLMQLLQQKDAAIAKILDKIDAVGLDLATIFPTAAVTQSGRKATKKREILSHVRGLEPFDRQAFLAKSMSLTDSHDAIAAESMIVETLCDTPSRSIAGIIERFNNHDEEQNGDGPATEMSCRETREMRNRTFSSPGDGTDTSEDELGRQEMQRCIRTPSGLKPWPIHPKPKYRIEVNHLAKNPATTSPKKRPRSSGDHPHVQLADEHDPKTSEVLHSGDTTDEDTLDFGIPALPPKESTPSPSNSTIVVQPAKDRVNSLSQTSASKMLSSPSLSPKRKKMCKIGGAATPSSPAPTSPTRRKLGTIGGAARAPASPPPASRPKKLGVIGGRSSRPPEQPSPSKSVAPSPAKHITPPAQTNPATPSEDFEEGAFTTITPSTSQTLSSPNQTREGVLTRATSKTPPSSSQSQRESSLERATRKREELKRQLDEQGSTAASSTKKKRRF